MSTNEVWIPNNFELKPKGFTEVSNSENKN